MDPRRRGTRLRGDHAVTGNPSRKLGPLCISTAPQASGSPVIDQGAMTEEGTEVHYSALVIRPPLRSDRSLTRPNRDAKTVRAVAIGWRGHPHPVERAKWIAHNVVAHPLLVICPPLGERLHDATVPGSRRIRRMRLVPSEPMGMSA